MIMNVLVRRIEVEKNSYLFLRLPINVKWILNINVATMSVFLSVCQSIVAIQYKLIIYNLDVFTFFEIKNRIQQIILGRVDFFFTLSSEALWDKVLLLFFIDFGYPSKNLINLIQSRFFLIHFKISVQENDKLPNFRPYL